MLIWLLTICVVEERDRNKHGIMYLLLQENMYHSYFVYVNLYLDNYDVRILKPQDERRDTESISYENIFDIYGSRSNSAENNAMSLTNFVNKYE